MSHMEWDGGGGGGGDGSGTGEDTSADVGLLGPQDEEGWQKWRLALAAAMAS